MWIVQVLLAYVHAVNSKELFQWTKNDECGVYVGLEQLFVILVAHVNLITSTKRYSGSTKTR